MLQAANAQLMIRSTYRRINILIVVLWVSAIIGVGVYTLLPFNSLAWPLHCAASVCIVFCVAFHYVAAITKHPGTPFKLVLLLVGPLKLPNLQMWPSASVCSHEILLHCA